MPNAGQPNPRQHPSVRLAFGGVFATLNAAMVKQQCPTVDFVCRGDGEQLLLDLLERMDDPASIAGLTWAKGGHVVHNPNRPLDRNLDQWPFPDRESLPLDFIESMPLDVPAILSTERFTTMQTSRGCPWPCIFCDIPVFNDGKWRARRPLHVVEEFKHLRALGYGAVYFVDNDERSAGFRRVFHYKLIHFPWQSLRVLRRRLRHMRLREVLHLLVKPFLGDNHGPTTNVLLSRAVEHGGEHDAAAFLTPVAAHLLERTPRPPQAQEL